MTTISILRYEHYGLASGSVAVSDTRGVGRTSAASPICRSRRSTDPAGSTTLTLTNVVNGSRYRIERQGDGSLATPTNNAEGVAGASTVNITLDYYSVGSANNNLKLKLIDLTHEIEEITFTISAVPYIIQSQGRSDPWYSNPA